MKFGWTSGQIDEMRQEHGKYFLFELLLEETWSGDNESPSKQMHNEREAREKRWAHLGNKFGTMGRYGKKNCGDIECKICYDN